MILKKQGLENLTDNYNFLISPILMAAEASSEYFSSEQPL